MGTAAVSLENKQLHQLLLENIQENKRQNQVVQQKLENVEKRLDETTVTPSVQVCTDEDRGKLFLSNTVQYCLPSEILDGLHTVEESRAYKLQYHTNYILQCCVSKFAHDKIAHDKYLNDTDKESTRASTSTTEPTVLKRSELISKVNQFIDSFDVAGLPAEIDSCALAPSLTSTSSLIFAAAPTSGKLKEDRFNLNVYFRLKTLVPV